MPISVCSSVRTGLSFAPSVFTSLYAAAYSGLSSAGGGGGRNRSSSGMAKGFTAPQFTPRFFCVGFSGSGRQSRA